MMMTKILTDKGVILNQSENIHQQVSKPTHK